MNKKNIKRTLNSPDRGFYITAAVHHGKRLLPFSVTNPWLINHVPSVVLIVEAELEKDCTQP